MPYGVKKTQIKPVNAVAVATEADVIAAPASGKAWRLLKAALSSDTAGVYFFQAGATAVDLFSVILEASKNPVTIDFGEDGIPVGTDKALQCDGPANSALTGYFVVVEE